MTDLAEWLLEQIAADERRQRARRRMPDVHGKPCPACGEPLDGYEVGSFHDYDMWTLLPCEHEIYTSEMDELSPPRSAANPFVLANLAAKRRIVEIHDGAHECPDGGDTCGWIDGELRPYCDTLRLLAFPYADRPGYDSTWVP